VSEIQVKVTAHGERTYLTMYYIDPTSGKRRDRSTKVPAERNAKGEIKAGRLREAERVAAKWEAELAAGRYKPASKMAWEEFRERYEDEKLDEMSRGMQDASAAAFNHLERVIAPKQLASVTSTVLSRFKRELRREKMTGTTIATHLRHIRAALGWAVDEKEWLADRPRVKLPATVKGQKLMRGRPLALEEFERMLGQVEAALTPADSETPKKRWGKEAVQRYRERVAKQITAIAPDWRHFLRGLWLSGLRLGEALILSWDEDSDFFVDLTGKYPRFRIYAPAQKGRRDELLPMTPDFVEFLLKTPPHERSGLVFNCRGLKGRRLQESKVVSKTVSWIGRAAGVIVDKSKDQCATAHDLRRSFGTRWSKMVKPATLQRLMRHKDIATTMKYYVDQDADDIAAELWEGQGKVGTFVGTWPETPETEATNPAERKTQPVAEQRVASPV